jgi:hypothetical protein
VTPRSRSWMVGTPSRPSRPQALNKPALEAYPYIHWGLPTRKSKVLAPLTAAYGSRKPKIPAKSLRSVPCRVRVPGRGAARLFPARRATRCLQGVGPASCRDSAPPSSCQDRPAAVETGAVSASQLHCFLAQFLKGPGMGGRTECQAIARTGSRAASRAAFSGCPRGHQDRRASETGPRPFLLGRRVSYVDLSLFQVVSGLTHAFPVAMASVGRRLPRLRGVCGAVEARPRMQPTWPRHDGSPPTSRTCSDTTRSSISNSYERPHRTGAIGTAGQTRSVTAAPCASGPWGTTAASRAAGNVSAEYSRAPG